MSTIAPRTAASVARPASANVERSTGPPGPRILTARAAIPNPRVPPTRQGRSVSSAVREPTNAADRPRANCHAASMCRARTEKAPAAATTTSATAIPATWSTRAGPSNATMRFSASSTTKPIEEANDVVEAPSRGLIAPWKNRWQQRKVFP